MEEIAKILDCTPVYILNYQDYKKRFYDQFHENAIRNKSLINQQIFQNAPSHKIIILQEELLKSERNRIALLEALLRNNKINF